MAPQTIRFAHSPSEHRCRRVPPAIAGTGRRGSRRLRCQWTIPDYSWTHVELEFLPQFLKTVSEIFAHLCRCERMLIKYLVEQFPRDFQ
jgi:hypothetical protein